MIATIKRLGIGTRVGGGFVISTLGILALVVPSLLGVITDMIDQGIDHEVTARFDTFQDVVDSEVREASALATLVAQMPLVKAAMVTGDRDRLAQEFVPGFKEMAARFGVEQMQFHQSPALSLLRVHKPEKFGDDLSSFRQTVVEANAGRKVVTGLEGGVAGLGIRAVVPVSGEKTPGHRRASGDH